MVGGHSPVLDSGKKLWEKSLTIHFALTHSCTTSYDDDDDDDDDDFVDIDFPKSL